MPVFMAGMDHRTVWRFTGAVLGQGFLHARCCATCGVMVQTVQYTVWRFRSCSSSRSSTLPFDAQWQFPMVLFVQKTIEFPQFVFGGRCPCLQVFAQVQLWIDSSDSQLQPVDSPPRCAGLQVPQVRSVRRQSRSHCCCFTPDSQYIDKVVDVPVVFRMPVVVQQQVP